MIVNVFDRFLLQVQAVRSLEALAQSPEVGRTARLRFGGSWLAPGPLQHHCIGSGSEHTALIRIIRIIQFQALLQRRVVDRLPRSGR